MSKRLEGKIAIITGGSKGIGAQCVKLFAREGATVIAGSRSPLEYTAQGAEYANLDVTNTASVAKVVGETVEKYGRIDILVNNAGITRDALVQKTTDQMWEDVIDVNLKGVFNMVREVAPVMIKNGYGSIINISSIVGESGNIGQTNYSASKAGVIGMTKTWAKELARKGGNIRVNGVTPGYILTDMLKTVPEELLEQFAKMTMLGRLGKPEEVAAAVLFLASDEASYITGHILSVSGGMRL